MKYHVDVEIDPPFAAVRVVCVVPSDAMRNTPMWPPDWVYFTMNSRLPEAFHLLPTVPSAATDDGLNHAANENFPVPPSACMVALLATSQYWELEEVKILAAGINPPGVGPGPAPHTGPPPPAAMSLLLPLQS